CVVDDHWWHEDHQDNAVEGVWAQVEAGACARLPFRALQIGDERCNRTTYGFYLGDRYFPLLDEQDPTDLNVRDIFFRHLGGVNLSGNPPMLLAVTLLRVLARHPSVAVASARWAVRMVRRTGLRALVRHRIRPVTFVMHSFMDAADVAPAWEAMQRGQDSTDPRIAVTQQRLRACSYAMAHPETGELVPSCVQHCVLDPAENAALRRLLPLAARRPAGSARAGSARAGSAAAGPEIVLAGDAEKPSAPGVVHRFES
ncbi:MAG: hypothetical protein ACR2P2_18465, partial [Nakamurella sp.]